MAAAPRYALPLPPSTERSRRHIGRKCVKAGIRKCVLEGLGRPIGRSCSLRTSTPTPNRTQQKALFPEVRNGRNPGMCPGGGSGGRFATAPLYALPLPPPTERSRRHISRKCVTDEIRECALEGARRSIRHGASLRTSTPTLNRTQQKAHWPEVREGRNPRMRPGGASEVDSPRRLSTHFRAHPQQSGAEGTSAGSA